MPGFYELHVRLSPKAAQNRIQGWHRDEHGEKILKVSVTAVPEKGKANKALIEFLAKRLGIAKSDIVLVRGETDRNKILSLPEITRQAIENIG